MKAAINNFKDKTGHIDLNSWRHDICARLQMDDAAEGLTTSDLCMVYFGYADLEMKLWINDQMQAVRQMLQERALPLILRTYSHRWYIVNPKDGKATRDFISERALRFIRGHKRLQRYSEIGQETYRLSANDRLLTAIGGATAGVHRIEQVLQLEKGKSNGKKNKAVHQSRV